MYIYMYIYIHTHICMYILNLGPYYSKISEQEAPASLGVY